MKIEVTPENVPDVSAFPLSHGMIAGDLIFTSGQIHMTPKGKLVDGSFEDKTKQVLDNLQAVVKEAGSSLAEVVKVTVYITDFENYEAFNSTYATYFEAPYPAREVIGVKDLPAGADLEISVVAQRTKDGGKRKTRG